MEPLRAFLLLIWVPPVAYDKHAGSDGQRVLESLTIPNMIVKIPLAIIPVQGADMDGLEASKRHRINSWSCKFLKTAAHNSQHASCMIFSGSSSHTSL